MPNGAGSRSELATRLAATSGNCHSSSPASRIPHPASRTPYPENNRKARYYDLTAAGRKQVVTETENWDRVAIAIARALKAT
ncbi:MAG: hypothetical protein H0W08_26155 [Acidobacteria bacterium]|nr:hypothetical protein [Acidobacteriota bacterium]